VSDNIGNNFLVILYTRTRKCTELPPNPLSGHFPHYAFESTIRPVVARARHASTTSPLLRRGAERRARRLVGGAGPTVSIVNSGPSRFTISLVISEDIIITSSEDAMIMHNRCFRSL
jgi:hypothetical protein